MDLLKDSVRPLYFRYLAAAFGSALITSVYSIVDMMVVGQAVGPQGTAALAVVAPVWNVLYSLGLLMGIGGSVLFSHARGRNSESANDYFTAALAGTCLLAGAWPVRRGCCCGCGKSRFWCFSARTRSCWNWRSAIWNR